jgi:hypothetical protein
MNPFVSPALIALALTSVSIPALADDEADISAAQKAVRPLLARTCTLTANEAGDFADANHVFELRYRVAGQGQDEPDNRLTLVQLFCKANAYNFTSVYVAENPGTGEFSLLSFAEPKLDYDYLDENFTALKAPPKIVGYITRNQLVNSAYDPAAKSISMRLKWSAKADAWSSGTWQFVDGEFVLRQYDIDPTYDPPGGDAKPDLPAQPASYQIFPQLKIKYQ